MEDKEAAREFFKRPLDKVRALNDQIKVFICRGSSISEELADRTINRVAIKLPEIEGTYSGDPTAYFLSAAKFIYLESQRRERIPPDHYDVTLLDEELNQKLVIHGIATQHTATGKQLTVSVTGIYLPAGQLTMKATGV
jgi:hypothetical protein